MKDSLVIIPAFNEEACIRDTVQELLEAKLDADICVVNDGSSDQTGTIAGSFPICVIHHQVNLGYGAALQTGYAYAVMQGYRYVVQFDADGQHATRDLKQLIAEMHKDDADIVVGSRFLGNARYNPGIRKNMALRTFRSIIYLVTRKKVSDPTSGLRGLNENIFRFYSRKGNFPSDFPDADIIIHMLLNRFVLREFPIGAKERSLGVSMHSGIKPLIYMFKVLLSILAVLLNYSFSERRHQDV